jgi:hypothetical protein
MVLWLKQVIAWLREYLPGRVPEVEQHVEATLVWNPDIGPADAANLSEAANGPFTEGNNIYHWTLGVIASPDWQREFFEENNLPEETESSTSASGATMNGSSSSSTCGDARARGEDTFFTTDTFEQGSATSECTKCSCHCPGYTKASPGGSSIASETIHKYSIADETAPATNEDDTIRKRGSIGSVGEIIDVYFDAGKATTRTIPTQDTVQASVSTNPEITTTAPTRVFNSSTPDFCSAARRTRPSPLNIAAASAFQRPSTIITLRAADRRLDIPAPWHKPLGSCAFKSLNPPTYPSLATASALAAALTPRSRPSSNTTRPENSLESTIRRRDARKKKEAEFQGRERLKKKYVRAERSGFWYWRDAGI